MDALELRGWFSSNALVPSRDLTDALGQALLATFSDKPGALKTHIDSRTESLGNIEAVRKELYGARWGPTRLPIYNVILQLFLFTPEKKMQLLDLTRYLAWDVEVPVDGTDVLGATALYWAISTKPYAEAEFAQILFDVGGSVNQKNRLGGTAAGEIAQVDFKGDTSKSVEMMRWWFEHGGDVDAQDNDGMNVKTLVEMMRGKVPGMAEILKKGRGVRKEGNCGNCGRAPSEKKFATCAKCKSVRYCSQECQKVDWKGHKKVCIVAA